SAARTVAEFGPAFDELNFSDALKTLWTLVAETDGYLTANAPWKRPTDRSEADHALLQARVLATAAEAIRIITALVYPVLPESAAKVWRQLGQGEIAEAAKHAFLTQLAWGGLKAGTKFGEPAPLFPRAEKDASDRMQKLEDENNGKAGNPSSQPEKAPKSAPEAPMSALSITPDPPAPPPTVDPAPAAASVQAPTNPPPHAVGDKMTSATTAPGNADKPVATAHVHEVPAELASSRLSSTPAQVPAENPLDEKSQTPDPLAAPTQPAQTNPTVISIDDFAKVELRVAQILVAERIPKADK